MELMTSKDSHCTSSLVSLWPASSPGILPGDWKGQQSSHYSIELILARTRPLPPQNPIFKEDLVSNLAWWEVQININNMGLFTVCAERQTLTSIDSHCACSPGMISWVRPMRFSLGKYSSHCPLWYYDEHWLASLESRLVPTSLSSWQSWVHGLAPEAHTKGNTDGTMQWLWRHLISQFKS